MMIPKKWILLAYQVWIVWMWIGQLSLGATILGPGDVQLIGYKSDSPDGIAFVNWAAIDVGTKVRFTDNGWQKGGTFRSGESDIVWMSDEWLPVGSVVVLSATAPPTSGSSIGRLSGLSSSGDQVLVYQGTPGSPDFVYGLDFNGSEQPAGWDADATSTRTSALPRGLLPGFHMPVRHFDNGEYSGSRTGMTIDEFQTAIRDVENWTFSNAASFGPLSAQTFQPAVVGEETPEPTAWILWIGVAGSFLLVRYVMKGRRY